MAVARSSVPTLMNLTPLVATGSSEPATAGIHAAPARLRALARTYARRPIRAERFSFFAWQPSSRARRAHGSSLRSRLGVRKEAIRTQPEERPSPHARLRPQTAPDPGCDWPHVFEPGSCPIDESQPEFARPRSQWPAANLRVRRAFDRSPAIRPRLFE